MKPQYSVVVVHGIGAGKGEERRGFSKKLKQRVAKVCPDIDAYWHEAPWEEINDAVDDVVQSVVDGLIDGYIEEASASKRRSQKGNVRTGLCFIVKLFKKVKKAEKAVAEKLAPLLLRVAKRGIPYALDLLLDLPLYLSRDHGKAIRGRVREKIEEVFRKTDRGVILVGHSLGSVIAYDVLAEMIAKGENQHVKALVTFGSPLGWVMQIRRADRNLPALPSDVSSVKWVNFYDSDDPIPLRRELDPAEFSGVENKRVDSGEKLLCAHCAYWSNAEVAKCLAGLMRGEEIA